MEEIPSQEVVEKLLDTPATTPSQSLLRREFRREEISMTLEPEGEEALRYIKDLSQDVEEALNCKKEECSKGEEEVKESSSPTTSTPGNSPLPNQGILKSSELHDSEESMIEPVTPVTRMKAETRLSVTSPPTLQLKTTEMGHFFISYIIVAGVSLTTYLVQKAILLHFMTVMCDKCSTLFY